MPHSINNKFITILTPSYNRCQELEHLYASLSAQTCKDFCWLIVDDGSSDLTPNVVAQWQKQKNTFPIFYVWQGNKGKHCALNRGIALISTPMTFIVDSDDRLTSDAIETIQKDIQPLLKDDTICGIGYLRGDTEMEVIGDKYSEEDFISDFITERFKKNVGGDKAEVWKTDDLKKYPYPEFEEEKFLSESYVWCSLAKSKKMLFRNKIIYITKYLPGGLSESGRSLRMKCPQGGMFASEMMMDPAFNIRNRIKGALLYVAYGKLGNLNLFSMLKKSRYPHFIFLFYLPGLLLYCYWKNRYSES